MPTQAELSQLQLEAKGLYTNPNDLSKVPPGAFKEAKNTVIDRPGIIETRRGVDRYGINLGLGDGIVDAFYSFQSTMLLHQGLKFKKDSNGAGTWVAYAGNYDIPSSAHAMHSFQSNKNIYFGTSVGVYKLDAIASALKLAGTPQALDGQGSTTGSGWFSNNTQVAYRIVWGYVDANNNTILGAPSERIVISNSSGGATNSSLTFTIPSDITVSYFYQIYRSPLSIDLVTPPNDEMQLVLQNNPSAAQITAKAVTLTDSVPDALKGATIYTAASQQGILQSNFQPPIAADVTTFKGFSFYANTTNKQMLDLTLLAVSGASGLALNDTITIAGTVYTAKAAENTAAGEFRLETALTPAENIAVTAQSLVHVINTYASNTTVYGYYVSGFNELPGRITIKERGYGASSFTVAVSRATAWYFQSVTSMNDVLPARVLISKFQQPEAVPLINFIDVGSADQPIYRIIALRNSVFVFKEDGVYRITGDDLSSFAVAPWDTTVTLRAPESAVLLNNQIYCYTTQGIIAVSETGSSIVSIPIENTLLELSSDQYVHFDSVTFGIGYESDRKYIMPTVSAPSNESATHAYVYNYITNTYNEWEYPVEITAGFLNPVDNRLYVASSNALRPYVYQERKSFTSTDFADEDFAVTIVSSSGTTVTVASSANIAVGYTLNQGFQNSKVTAITDATRIVVENVIVWDAGAAIAYEPIKVVVEWVPIHTGNPTVTKLFQEIMFYFSEPDFNSIEVGAASNFSQDFESWNITPLTQGNYGEGDFGEGIYGGTFGGTQPIRTWLPVEKCRAHWINLRLSLSEALTRFALAGVSIGCKSLGARFR